MKEYVAATRPSKYDLVVPGVVAVPRAATVFHPSSESNAKLEPQEAK